MPLYKGIKACYMVRKHLTYFSLIISMLYVCYMFEQHITYCKVPVYRHLSLIMLYGYMFLRNS